MVLNRWSRNTWRWSACEHETGELQMYNFRVQIIRILKPQESQRISIRFIDSNHEKGIFYGNRKTNLVPVKVNQCVEELWGIIWPSFKSIVQRVSTFSVLGWTIVHIPQFGCFAVSSYHRMVWKVVANLSKIPLLNCSSIIGSTIQSIVFHSQFISIAFIHTSHLLDISPFTFFACGIFSHPWWCRWSSKAWISDFTFFKQQFKASLEQFYIFNFSAEGQHESNHRLHCLHCHHSPRF